MSAGYTVSPASLDLRDHLNDQSQQSQNQNQNLNNNYNYNYTHNFKTPITPVESHLLSPFSSHIQSNSASPASHFTPADSVSTNDIYQSSDLSSDFGDAWLGVNFDNVDDSGAPSFLGGFDGALEPSAQSTQNYGFKDVKYPLSPHQTPSVPPTSVFAYTNKTSTDVRPFAHSITSTQSAAQLTPSTNGDSFSSEDNPEQSMLAMAPQSPRVTVSMWNQDDDALIQGIERSFMAGAESPRPSQPSAGDLAGEPSHGSTAATVRDTAGNWVPHSATGNRGLAPGDRPPDEVPSLNQQTNRRQRHEKNKEVYEWVSRSSNGLESTSNILAGGQDSEEDNIPTGEIPLGNSTENKHIEGQAYYNVDGPGGPITQTDFDIMRQLNTWADAPAIYAIQSGPHYQPESSQAAIEKFNRQCQDNESIVSRAATWGTRRRSLPSLVDMEGVVSGNFLKKLSISSHSRRPNFIKRFPSLVRKPSGSQNLKRKGSNASEAPPQDLDEQERRESKDTLAPPSRTTSWGITGITKKPTPNLNTALVGMATGAASIGTTHARSGSISTPSMTSPKSPFGSLSIPPNKKSLRRPRSKTELPKSSNSEFISHPNLVQMLKRQGGPPVASLVRHHQPAVEPEEDEEEEDDEFDDGDVKAEPSSLKIIEPTFAGFREHVLALNPGLVGESGWLADRIAHQLVVRYKHLQTAKIKHLNQVNFRKCTSGALCLSLGGSAVPLDGKNSERSIDPLSTRPDSSDSNTTPLEGGINSESFPPGIPMPPTTALPAEFECQLCFMSKRFLKPSDWTKHVHEDVQPFTCTWEKCREPKMFKRKADWVRHENEGHRHLEWWTCDVDDCRHICYRRDNFLQHLVREHKFTEPRIKTKAAIKKAGGGDHTWQKVEQCHVETQAKPSDEPCRFCRKTFPTWKKLTVHLAKHMENISLPVLSVVNAKKLEADTIISPVQDPPRPSFPAPPVKQEHPSSSFESRNNHNTIHTTTTPNSVPTQQNYPQMSNTNYSNPSQMPMSSAYYTTQQRSPYPEMPNNQYPNIMIPQNYTNLQPPQTQYNNPLAIITTMGPSSSSSPYGPSTLSYNTSMQQQQQQQQEGLEPFPELDLNPLGIQDPSGSMCYENLGHTGGMQPVEQQYASHPGSVSPYGHSPHPGHNGGGFYNA